MRVFTLLLCLPAFLGAQAKLSPQDESEIRVAIEERAKQENQQGSPDERSRILYSVGNISPITVDVATADATSRRVNGPSARRQYVFILTRATGNWTITRKIQVCPAAAPVTIQPITSNPR